MEGLQRAGWRYAKGRFPFTNGTHMTTKRVTISDIARLAGTSTATISHYLNGKLDKMSESTQQRIAKVIEETGYSPNAHAQGLASKSSGVIAVLILDNTNTWAGQLVRGVEGAAHRNGYLTVVCDTHFNPEVERSYVEKMLSLGVDGFVIQPTTHYRSVTERLRKVGKPAVFYDFSIMDLGTTWVKSDLYGGVYDAISACVDKGYEDFIMLSTGPEGARTRVERHQGFSDALGVHGIRSQYVRIDHESPSATSLRHYFEQNIHPSRRTLVFCPHQWALGRVLKALKPMSHLVPDRIGILGLNNADWTDLAEPSITTIVEPVEREGDLACEMLIDLMRNPDTKPRQEMLSCETRWLSSTR